MDFRLKVLVIPVCFALVPVLVTGAYGSVLAERLLTSLVEARTREAVQRSARAVEAGASDGSPEAAIVAADVSLDPPLADGSSQVYLVDTERGRIASVGPVADVSLAVDTAMIVAAAAEAHVAPSGGRSVDSGAGGLYLFPSALEGGRWVVVGLAALDGVAGTRADTRRLHLAFVLLLGLGAAVGLAFLLDPLLRTVTDLTDAADVIAGGDLAPWLPPHTGGEAGRLSLATGTMVSRVEAMMRGAEQSARLAMVGQLATYLAHEIRNPLSSIRLNLQSMARELEAGSIPADVHDVTELCLGEIQRLDKVASSVLQVGRARAPEPEPGSLHETVRHAAAVLTPELSRRRIPLSLDMRADEDEVELDRESIRSVFLALIMNAAEAIGEDGWIRLATHDGRTAEGEPAIVVEVEDSGPGVPRELRERIFDPFFTTKKEGTGVGLAAASEAVRAHGGALTLSEDEGAGSCFVVTLPLLHKESPVAGAVS